VPRPLPRRELFGFRFVDADFDEVIDALVDGTGTDPLLDAPAPLVFTPNVDLLVHLDRDDSPRTTALVRRAAYVLADGQPVVWASRLLGRPLQQRLAGSSLVERLWPRVIEERRSVLVIAPNNAVAELVHAQYPKARIVVPPFFHADDPAAITAIAEDCYERCAGEPPEFVFACLSYPKQYTLLDELIEGWPGRERPRLYLAVGASFELYYGTKRRAPAWMAAMGLEWFHRFLQEPRRLFRRYFVDDLAFVGIVWREWRRLRQPVPVTCDAEQPLRTRRRAA
jgi:N-acetylglucosaminyldiphosphoundecaprenol N-acetyl-beta-D-mannosaminyltransferase